MGATYYYTEYTLINSDGDVIDHELIDLTTSKKANLKNFGDDVELSLNETYLLKQQKTKKQEIKALWNALEQKGGLLESASSNKNTNPTISSQSIGWISGVPGYMWYLGCSPTASAMVLGYWDGHGYPNYLTGNTLIEELADAMGTSNWPSPTGGTWPWDIDNGIETVSVNHGYSNLDATNDYWVTWSEIQNEINAQRPFVLSMTHGGTGSGNSQPYGDHSVTALGYSDGYADGSKYIHIHDTWSTSTRSITYGNWWAAMSTWVRP